jgi:serine/threonine-protein kinase
LLFRRDSPQTLADIVSMPLDGSAPPTPVLATAADEFNGEVSPDGRYLAYESNESGSQEVYVRPFPNVQAGRWRISTNGGRYPAWAAAGRELYYVSADAHLLRVDVTTSPAFRASPPTTVLPNPIFAAIIQRSYDVTPDGKRYLVIEDATRGRAITVVTGWGEELKRLVPNGAQR